DEALARSLVRDERGAGVLERLAAGDVVEVVVTVDHVLDRLARDLLDLVDVGHHRLRTPVADRVGRDHARGRDDEHRLGVSVTENIDVVGAVDLGGRERRRRRLLRVSRGAEACCSQGGDDETGLLMTGCFVYWCTAWTTTSTSGRLAGESGIARTRASRGSVIAPRFR